MGASGQTEGMLGFGLLEWTFVALLVVLVVATSLFALFVVLQLFRNPHRAPQRRRHASREP